MISDGYSKKLLGMINELLLYRNFLSDYVIRNISEIELKMFNGFSIIIYLNKPGGISVGFQNAYDDATSRSFDTLNSAINYIIEQWDVNKQLECHNRISKVASYKDCINSYHDLKSEDGN